MTKTFRFVASTFSDVRSFEWETLASGVDGDLAYTVAIERHTASVDGGPLTESEPAPRTRIAARTNIGARCTATPTAGRLTEPPAKRWPTVTDRGVIR